MKIILLILLGLSILEFGYSIPTIKAYTNNVLNLIVKKMNEDPVVSSGPKWVATVVNVIIKIVDVWYSVYHVLVLMFACWMFYDTLLTKNQLPILIDSLVILYAIYDWAHSTHQIQRHLKIPNYYQNQFDKYDGSKEDEKSMRK